MRKIIEKPWLHLAVLLLMSAALFSHRPNSKTPSSVPPNVVIIFMDDMGYGDLECYSGIGYHTPNINKLAAEGMRFTNFYAAQATCTASRAALLTGCYSNRVGMHGAIMPRSHLALNPEEMTIASSLKRAGYNTCMVGKWHLGSKPPFLPIHYGFDEYLGLPYSNDMWPVDYNGKPVTDSDKGKFKHPPLPLLEGDRPIKYIRTLDDQGELTGLYTQKACEFIRKNKAHPFFLYFAHSMVHVPIAVSPAFRGKSKDGLFGDVMMEVDWSVQQVMKTLKEEGLDENTLVVFTSDNGPWLRFGDHAGNTGGLREGKGTSFEGGQREPCIMRWPGKIPPGVVCNKIAATMDLFPTIANICRSPLPDRRIDGVNILSLLYNQPEANPRNELLYYYGVNNLEAVRRGKWKLVLPHNSQTYKKFSPGKNGYPAPYANMDVPLALYNLSLDPGETVDVQSSYPDILAQMKQLADSARQTLGDGLSNMPCKECRPAGYQP